MDTSPSTVVLAPALALCCLAIALPAAYVGWAYYVMIVYELPAWRDLALALALINTLTGIPLGWGNLAIYKNRGDR